MNRKYILTIFVIAVVAIPMALFAVVKWTEDKYSELPLLPNKDHVIGEFSLVDQHGKSVTPASWQGKTTVVNFFFTTCPVICPKMINQLKRVQAYADIKNLQIQSYSVDPERDSVQKLKEYASRLSIGGNWQLVTGEKITIYRLARKGFNIVATDGDGGEEDFIHSELFILVDSRGKIRGYYNGTEKTEVDQLIRDMEKLQ